MVRAEVYPNPVDNCLRVEAENMSHVLVFDLLGQVVFEMNCDGNVMDINVSSWSEGVYLM